MNQSIPYPSNTRIDRDRSIRFCEVLLENAQQTLNLMDAGQTVATNLAFRRYVETLIEEYTAEIRRLRSIKYPSKGVANL